MEKLAVRFERARVSETESRSEGVSSEREGATPQKVLEEAGTEDVSLLVTRASLLVARALRT